MNSKLSILSRARVKLFIVQVFLNLSLYHTKNKAQRLLKNNLSLFFIPFCRSIYILQEETRENGVSINWLRLPVELHETDNREALFVQQTRMPRPLILYQCHAEISPNRAYCEQEFWEISNTIQSIIYTVYKHARNTCIFSPCVVYKLSLALLYAVYFLLSYLY